MVSLKKLEQRTALCILAFFHTSGKSRLYLSQLMRGIKEKDVAKVNRGVATLVELDLLVDKGLPKRGRGRKRWLVITEKGKRISRKVSEIKVLLE